MPKSDCPPVEALARRVRIGVTIAIPLTGVVTVAAMAGGFDSAFVAVEVSGDGLSAKAAAVCVLVVGLLCIGFLSELRAALGRIADGDSFGAAVRMRLARASALILAACVADIVLPSIFLLADSLSGTTHAFTLAVSGSDALALVTSTCLFFVARLLERAAAFEDDSRRIV